MKFSLHGTIDQNGKVLEQSWGKMAQLFSFVKVPRYIKAHVCRTQPCKTSKLTNKSTDDAENSSTIGIIEEFEKPPISDDNSNQ